MTAQLIDGTALSRRMRAEVAARAAALAAAAAPPGLAVILVGDDPASAGLRAQQGQGLRRSIGVHSVLERYAADAGARPHCWRASRR